MRGDEDGFVEFWQTSREPIRRALVATLGDAILAGEAVDEAMVRAFQRWSRVETLADPAGWVFRVGYNWATSWRRKLKRRPTCPIESLERPVDDPTVDVDLSRALWRLPEQQRVVVVLRYYLDWPVPRINAVLGWPEGTAKSRLHRALASLAKDREVQR